MLMQHFSGDAFTSWGWRVPFLASVLLFGLGVYLRTHMSESEEFASAMQGKKAERAPLVEVLKRHPKEVLMVFGLRLGEGAASWIFFAFSIAYGKFLGLSDAFVLGALTCSMLTMIPVSLLAGHLSDQIGRKPVYVAGALAIVVFAYPFFLLDRYQGAGAGRDGVRPRQRIRPRLAGRGSTRTDQRVAARTTSLFGHWHRPRGGVGSGSGGAPMVATALLSTYRSGVPIALYLAAMGAITLVAALLTPETYPASQRRKDRLERPALPDQAVVLNA